MFSALDGKVLVANILVVATLWCGHWTCSLGFSNLRDFRLGLWVVNLGFKGFGDYRFRQRANLDWGFIGVLELGCEFIAQEVWCFRAFVEIGTVLTTPNNRDRSVCR